MEAEVRRLNLSAAALKALDPQQRYVFALVGLCARPNLYSVNYFAFVDGETLKLSETISFLATGLQRGDIPQ